MKLKVAAISILLLGCSSVLNPATPTVTQHPIPEFSDQISRENASNLILLDSWYFADALFNEKITLTDMREIKINSWAWSLIYNFGDPDPQCRRGFRDTTTSNNPNYIISIYCTGELRIIDKNDDANYLYLRLDDRELSGVKISPSKKFLALFATDGTVWLLPTEDWEEKLLDDNLSKINAQPLSVIDLNERIPVAKTFSDDSSMLILVFENWDIQIWDLRNSSLLSEFQSRFKPQSIVLSPGHDIMTIASKQGDLDVWDVNNKKLLVKIQTSEYLLKGITFSANGQFLISLDEEDILRIWGVPLNIDERNIIMTATVFSQSLPTSTNTPFFPPTLTLTPTETPPSTDPLFPWPIKPPTIEQVEEIRNCNLRELVQKKYPSKDVFDKSHNWRSLESPCDLGVVASAFVEFSSDRKSIPNEGKLAFAQAFEQNPVIALADPLFYQYFGYENLVGVPPQYDQSVKSIIIDYEWSGLGDPHQIIYHIEIYGADSPMGIGNATVKAEPQELSIGIKHEVSQELIDEMSKAISDLIPIKQPFSLVPCTDNYPDWKIKLLFSDNQSLELRTYGSNMLYLGGPWYTEIEGLNYLQFSADIPIAVERILMDMGLPLGQPYAMTCSPENLIGKAFP
jgi:hypothetical protein